MYVFERSIQEWLDLNKKYDLINASLKEIKKHKTEKETEVLKTYESILTFKIK